MGVCHQRVLELHDVQDDTGPLFLIIVYELGIYKILLMWFQRLVIRLGALWSNDALHDELWNEVRRICIVLAAVGDNLPHWSLMPVSEVTADDGCLVERWNEVIASPMLLILLFVVFSHSWMLHLAELANSRRPNEQGEDVLPAVPALVLLIGDDFPLTSTWNHSLVANMPSNDASFLVDYVWVIQFIHAL